MRRARTGLLGGSFDPVHAGHLELARLAVERVGLDEVIFLPAARPPHKTDRPLSDGLHRYAMLALATLGTERFSLSTAELARGGRSYTIDTLRRLRRGSGERKHWHFLAGADTFAEIDTWRQARAALDMVEFIVFPRDGIDLAEVRRRVPPWVLERLVDHPPSDLRLAPAGDGRPRVHWIPLEAPAVSSTEVRRRARRGENLTGLVPALVSHYIEHYRLYRGRRSNAR